MTERQAWLKIAKACDKANGDGYFSPYEEAWPCGGLCEAVGILKNVGDITSETMISMRQKIHFNGPSMRQPWQTWTDYRWTVSKRGAKARAAFCRKMAELCKPTRKPTTRKAKA